MAVGYSGGEISDGFRRAQIAQQKKETALSRVTPLDGEEIIRIGSEFKSALAGDSKQVENGIEMLGLGLGITAIGGAFRFGSGRRSSRSR
jgi:hypothetical protein